jgi:hypothetical protein
MSIYPITTFDTFSRSDSDTWGSTDNGQTWNSDSETYWDTTGGTGKITVSSSTFPTYDIGWINLANYGGEQTTAQVLVLAKWTGTQTYPTTDCGPVLSYNGSNTGYFVRIQNNYNEIAIACYVNGTMYEINRTAKVINKDTWYWIRFERYSSGLRVKIWSKGSTEPSTWTLTTSFYDGSNPPGSGSWGWITRKTPDTHTIELDAFYGFTMEDETVDTTPVIDDFERDVFGGWGISPAGQVWQGHMSNVDPEIRTLSAQGFTELSGDGFAAIDMPGDEFYASVIGPSLTGNRETRAKFSINSSAGSTHAVIGLRGNMQVSGGVAQFTGYYCRVTSGSTQLTLYKITSFGGALTAITPSSTLAHTALTANTIYHCRFQVVGTTLQARIWADGNSEPSTWNVVATDSSITSGKLWLGSYQSTGTSTQRQTKFYYVEYDSPVVATTLHTDTGALTSTAITDTTLALRAAYLNDTDNDNSLTVEYRVAGVVAWTTFGGTKTRVASPRSWTFTITGLTQNTTYNVRVTHADPDTVRGTNPVTATFTTTNTGLDTGVVSVANVGANALDVNATYTADTNNNSTATVDYRLSSYEQNPISDYFSGPSGTLLQNHLPEVGGAWFKNTSSPAANFELWQGRVYPRTTVITPVNYYVDTILPTSEYEVQVDVIVNAMTGNIGVTGRFSNVADTGYLLRYNAGAKTIIIFKLTAGASVALVSYPYEPNIGDIFTLKLVIRDAYKAAELNGVEIMRTTDNTFTNAGYAGLRAIPLVTTEGSPTNQLTFDNFRVTYRTTGTQPIKDTFVGTNNTTLQSHAPDTGSTWIKHSANGPYDVKLWDGRLYLASSGQWHPGVYYNNTTIPVVEYDVQIDVHVAADSGRVGVAGRVNTSIDTMYVAWYETDTSNLILLKFVSGAFTVLGSYGIDPAIGSTFTLTLVIKDAYKAVLFNNVEVIRSTDNTITGAGKAGIRFQSNVVPDGTPTNQLLGDNFLVTYPTAWTSSGAMTANRTTKVFTRNVTGLLSDGIYEFRVTYADADSVQGVNPQYVVAQTIGQAIAVTSIGAITQATSLAIEVSYLYDTNNNSTMAIQYRSVMDYLWTTVPTTQIEVNRGTKRFRTTLVSLKPNSTYEVKAIPSDPNGIIEDTPVELIALFTTTGLVFDPQKEGKHYLWKVYDPENNYITTWHDAGEPEFAWHENGGVSDLSVTLPRRISDIQDNKSGISHQNRVDVWCLDPSSNGFGLNLSNDPEFDLGSWTLAANASIDPTGGPDGGNALKITSATSTQLITRERAIYLFRQLEEYNTSDQQVRESTEPYPVPLVIMGIAKARGSKLVLFVEAYNQNDVKVDQSDDFGETVGSDWQHLRFEYTPPSDATYLRVCAQNDGKGTMWLDKLEVRAKESLIYRGRIESYTPMIDQTKEEIEVQILGLVSLLSDDYLEFLQFVAVQPAADLANGRENLGPADPSDMLKIIIDHANTQNPHFALYYTADSIRATGQIMQYTFRDQQVRACFDKVRSLCPSGWHYYVEPDGLVNLRGPEHAPQHKLRLGVEIMNFSVEKSIRNLKNFVHVKGRQDEDKSEPDGHGSIHYVAFDQESIDKYGKRMLFIRDSSITDPDTAELVGQGRLEESNREEQRGQANIPDEKSIAYVGGALRGYNIESFRPGDNVLILDPVAGPKNTYWDSMVWDIDTWDSSNAFDPLPETVPIKTFQFQGTFGTLELSERPPASTQEFGRLYRWLQLKDADDS